MKPIEKIFPNDWKKSNFYQRNEFQRYGEKQEQKCINIFNKKYSDIFECPHKYFSISDCQISSKNNK